MYLLQNMHRINTQKQIHRKVSLNCDVWLLSVGIIFVKSGILKCRLNLMNGCSWEILHFITIYFVPAEEGVAQHSQHRGRYKHKSNMVSHTHTPRC